MMLFMKPVRCLYPLVLLFAVILVAARLMTLLGPQSGHPPAPSVTGAWVEAGGDVWVFQQSGVLVISGDGAPYIGSWRQDGDQVRLSGAREAGGAREGAGAREAGGPEVTEVRPVFEDGGATMVLTWQGRERRLTRVEER